MTFEHKQYIYANPLGHGLTEEFHSLFCIQVNFLSQIRLTNKGDGPKVAKRLIDVYFGLFKVSFFPNVLPPPANL
jgi:hypothetical protein